MKYGIKVYINEEDQLWVVDMNLDPVLYDSIDEAKKHVVFWGDKAKVEEYGEIKNTY